MAPATTASNKIKEDDSRNITANGLSCAFSVFLEDIAEATYFFASDLSNKSTGNFLNVDAGNAVSFSR